MCVCVFVCVYIYSMYTNLPVNVKARLRSRDSQDQKTFLVSSADNQSRIV